MPTVFTHAVAALALGSLFYRREVPKGIWALGAVCAALPDLDVVAFRFGIPYEHSGRGVAFLAPLSGERFFFPFQPIEVSPISIRRFLDGRGLAVLRSEILWVWMPAALLAGVVAVWRRGRRHSSPRPCPRP